MNRLLLVSTLVISATTSARADNDSPAPTSPIKWSLQVLYPRVAAGGIANEAHQSEFTIRALDAKRRPLAGIPVELPQVWRGKKELGTKDPDHSKAASPRVEWPSGRTAVTDVKGEVHGLFTSGERIGHFTLRGPGGTIADIEQIWNDEPDPFEGIANESLKGDTDNVPYKLGLRRGNKMIPIEGHQLKLSLHAVTLKIYKSTGILNENGRPKLELYPVKWKLTSPDVDTNSEENLRWETISGWFLFGDVHETAPGIYEGLVTAPSTIPKDSYPPPLFRDIVIKDIDFYAPFIKDLNVYMGD